LSKPELGDPVHYKPDPVNYPKTVYAAFVVKINEDTVNLGVLDENGDLYRAHNIAFVTDGSEKEFSFAFPRPAKVLVVDEPVLVGGAPVTALAGGELVAGKTAAAESQAAGDTKVDPEFAEAEKQLGEAKVGVPA
jgi:hypothetical protein